MKILYNRFFYRRYIKYKLKSCGNIFRLGYDSRIHKPQYVEIGENFYSGPRTYIGTNQFNPISIGRHVMFGSECMIIGGNHNIEFTDNHMIFNHDDDPHRSHIIIEDGAWIATRTILLSGAVISEGCVIGAMSLVNSYIPPYCVAAGVPAKVIKKRFVSKEKLQTLLLNTNSKLTVKKINEIYQKYSLPLYV